jgi:ketosteroid isomerase-like protein
MKIKISIVVATCLLCAAALLPVLSSQTNSSDAVAAVTKLENDQAKAALANDVSFIKTNLSDDAIEGTSFGEWLTKDSLVADGADPAKNKTNSMSITDLKVVAHGNVAIARYLNTYDDLYHGTHRSRSVICTDTWASEGGAWKLLANHCSQKK